MQYEGIRHCKELCKPVQNTSELFTVLILLTKKKRLTVPHYLKAFSYLLILVLVLIHFVLQHFVLQTFSPAMLLVELH